MASADEDKGLVFVGWNKVPLARARGKFRLFR